MADTKPARLAMAIVCIASLSEAGVYGDIYDIAHTLSGSKVVATHVYTNFDLMSVPEVYDLLDGMRDYESAYLGRLSSDTALADLDLCDQM
eukprot:4084098-Amphidinium_carterae.1